MRKSAVLSVICIFLAFGASTAFAQMVGLDWVPTGSGARALAMGGAFTAIADDATAAWWNPAGLTQLERPEFSLVGQHRKADAETVSSGNPPMSGTKSTLSANFASGVFPIGGKTEGARKTLSLSYGTFMDFNSETAGTAGNYQKYKGTLDNATLSFATELSQNLSLGAGLTYLFGGFKQSSVRIGSTESYDDDITGYGVAAGLLWKAKNLSIGLMGRTSMRLRSETSGEFASGPTTTPYHELAIIRYPYSLGIGAAYKPTENFTVALDVQYINLSALTTGYYSDKYGDIVQPRLGLEYLIITRDQNVIPLRVGAYYNPAGTLDRSGSEVSGFAYTAGTGIVFKDFQIDLAYIRAERDAYLIHTSDAVNKDVTQRILLSVIYRF